MNRRRIITAAAVTTAATLALAGCSGGGGGDADGVTTITYLSWIGEEQMGPIIDAFEEANPEVRIEVSYAPPVAEYIQTLQTRVLSGTAPDVFIMAAENKTNLIQGGHVVDLSGESFVDNVADFNLETYGDGEGGQFALSLGSWAGGFAYNVELLAEHGFDGIPETWDEFLEMAKELQDAGVTPFLEAVDAMPTTVSAMIGAQSSTMDPTLDAEIFSGASTFADEWTPVLEQYNRLFTEGIVPTDVVALDGEQVRDEFANGRVAIIGTAPWVITGIRAADPDLDFLFAPVPALEGSVPFQAGAASPGWAINAASDEAKQDAAKVFLGWLASPAAVEMINTATAEVTVTSDFEPAVDPSIEPLVPAMRDGDLYLPMISWERSEDVLNVEAVAQIQRMVQGQITPREAAEALDLKLAAS